MMYHFAIYFVSTILQVSYPCFYLWLWYLCYDTRKPQYFTFTVSSHQAIWQKFRSSFTKFLWNLMISICEKVRLQQLRMAKYSILASISQYHTFFQFFFLQMPHTYLYSASYTISSFFSEQPLKKCGTFLWIATEPLGGDSLLFYHSVPRISWYSIDQPQKDKRLIKATEWF